MRNRDPRSERTHKLLVKAFTKKMLAPEEYDRISVTAICEAAGVARSTFYEHFRTKDEILAASIRVPFTALARSVDNDVSSADLEPMLHHVWENRRLGRSLFFGSTRRSVTRVLTSMIRARLGSRKSSGDADVLAVALAEAQLGTVAAWLHGDLICSASSIATVIHAFSRVRFPR